MPGHYIPADPLLVRILVTAPTDTAGQAVEDSFPLGWSISQISHDGVLDTINQKVKWGPFFDDNGRVLTYVATPPATAHERVVFQGTASFDGLNISIFGERELTPGSRVFISAQGNSRTLTVGGEAGRSYVVEVSTDLVNWTQLGMVTISGGPVQIQDPDTASSPQRFYRAWLYNGE
jgi:hypothetical protein